MNDQHCPGGSVYGQGPSPRAADRRRDRGRRQRRQAAAGPGRTRPASSTSRSTSRPSTTSSPSRRAARPPTGSPRSSSGSGRSEPPTRGSSRLRDRAEVVDYKRVPGVQPSVMFEEFLAAEDIVRKDPRWQEAMRKRGVTDFDLCMIDPWSTPNVEPGVGPDDGRFVSPLTWVRDEPGRQRLRPPGRGRGHAGRPGHADRRQRRGLRRHPAAGRSRQLLRRGDDRPGQRPRASPTARARTSSRSTSPSTKARASPSTATTSAGRSGTCGSASPPARAWSCTGSATTAAPSIIHRASLSEMFVPYGDPGPTHYRKLVLDEGEYGIGLLTNSPGARLRLPGRDRLPGRRGQRQRRQGRHPAERHLPARRGPRHRLEAHRLPHRLRRGPADAPDGHLQHRHRRQLRVRLLLVPVPGRHHRVRGQALRRHLQRRRRRGRNARARRRSSPPASTARTTSTSSTSGWTWRSTAPPTGSTRSPRPR